MASWPVRAAAFAAMASTLYPERSSPLADQALTVWPKSTVCVAQTEETSATGVFHGVGVVTAIDADSGALTLDHEDIAGLMPAMVMMYRVESRDLDAGLSVGDRVAFDLDGKRYVIVGVKRLPSK